MNKKLKQQHKGTLMACPCPERRNNIAFNELLPSSQAKLLPSSQAKLLPSSQAKLLPSSQAKLLPSSQAKVSVMHINLMYGTCLNSS
jgi:hypothetical protein